MRLANKVAIITGAGSGMGKTAALLFAAEGAKVAASDINEASVKETVAEITKQGGAALAIRTDVSKGPDVKRMVDEAVAKFGALDILYNNAGIEGDSAFLSNMTEEQFDRVIAINLRGVFLGMKYALPHMMKARSGSIINTASIAGLVAVKGGAGYSAAKAGVIALTRVAALEYGRYNIRVNAICPGAIETPMAERIRAGVLPNQAAIKRISVLERMAKPEEIAKVALFLASDDASFATGAPFIIDGGWTVT
ncbi:MAG TPA: SDR family NAD(P)-dependent oxidoreductase [Candidatus Binataceae bacterium]|nr:SDR family NAD(P)-dependent oxidoreductase [Candidatus Binataceae bacterium]